jgi:hypothetical protein
MKVHDSFVSVMMVLQAGQQKIFLFNKASKLALVPHPACYSMGTGALLPMVKYLGCEADHSPPFSAKVKNE